MTFDEFIAKVIKPMFPGMESMKSSSSFQGSNQDVVSKVGNKLRVRQAVKLNNNNIELSRRQLLSNEEIDLIRFLISTYQDVSSTAKTYTEHLQEFIIQKSISKFISNNNQKMEELALTVLSTFSLWSSQTYEGERISSGMLLCPSIGGGQHLLLLSDLVEHDFSKALTDGVNSWWIVNSEGKIIDFINLEGDRFKTSSVLASAAVPAAPSSNQPGSISIPAPRYFPICYEAIALQSKDNKVAVTLNSKGEILVFAQTQLMFAKRRGDWIYFPHDSIIKQLSNTGGGTKEIRQSIYESCLDASFARSGACIGLLTEKGIKNILADKSVNADDVVSNISVAPIKSQSKAKAVKLLANGKSFHELPRGIRKEMMCLDGAIVLKKNGEVYAGGAILKLKDGIEIANEGGRSAAAKSLAHYGVGIKVSEDGKITAYKKGKTKVEKEFSVG